MQAHNRRNDRQPQPEPAFLITTIGTIKALEHCLPLCLRNPGPRIEHFNPRMSPFIDPTQNHLAIRRRELDRVAQQVRHRFE